MINQPEMQEDQLMQKVAELSALLRPAPEGDPIALLATALTELARSIQYQTEAIESMRSDLAAITAFIERA